MCSIPLKKCNKYKNVRYFLFCYRFHKRNEFMRRCVCGRNDCVCFCIYDVLIGYCYYKHYGQEVWLVVENRTEVKVYSQFPLHATNEILGYYRWRDDLSGKCDEWYDILVENAACRRFHVNANLKKEMAIDIIMKLLLKLREDYKSDQFVHLKFYKLFGIVSAKLYNLRLMSNANI